MQGRPLHPPIIVPVSLSGAGVPAQGAFSRTNGAAAGAPGSGGPAPEEVDASPAPRHRVWHLRGCGTSRLLPTGLPASRRDESPRVKTGRTLPGAGLLEPGGRDGGSPSRTGPGTSLGGLAGGWGSPSWLAAAGTGREERSPAVSQVFVLTYSRTQACGWDGNERCSARPLPGPIFIFAGRTEGAPGTGGRGPPHPVPSARHRERKTPRHLRWPGRASPGAELRRRGLESDGAPSARPREPSGCFLREGKEINHQRAFIVIIIIIIVAIIVSLHINK